MTEETQEKVTMTFELKFDDIRLPAMDSLKPYIEEEFKTLRSKVEELLQPYLDSDWYSSPTDCKVTIQGLKIQDKEDLPYGKDAMCICADCGEIVPMWVECESTRQPDHDGIWADCPECGITGVE